MIVTEDGTLSPSVVKGASTPELDRVLHATIKKTHEDVENLSFNTTIAQFMIFVNEFTKAEQRSHVAMTAFVQCLAPFAPHITEELWQILGHEGSVHHSQFPAFDEAKLVENEIEIVLQVSSKIRGKMVVPADADAAAIEELAKSDPNVQKHLDGKQIKKTIVVPGKLVNFIVG
jgi:leucyl-tRNA synthetase